MSLLEILNSDFFLLNDTRNLNFTKNRNKKNYLKNIIIKLNVNDFGKIFEIINYVAKAYKDVIPDD